MQIGVSYGSVLELALLFMFINDLKKYATSVLPLRCQYQSGCVDLDEEIAKVEA